MPIFIFLSLGIIEIPANIFKRYLMFKARKKREKFKDLIVIGITGSYGKSSTKEFLYTMLSKKYGEDKVLKTEGNVNTEIGVANTVLKKLNNNHKFFICEMGAYKRGEIRIACNIVMPKIGILTGINEQHLALFGSMENLVSAEGGLELAENLPQNGILVLNGDNETVKLKYQVPSTKYQQIFCSTKEKTDLWTENIKVEKDWLYFRVCDKARENADFKINLVGRQNIENILLAAACAKELGMSLSEIAKACEKITPQQGAMRLIQSPTLADKSRTLDVIDSTYSANPDGVLAALEHLKLWSSCQKVIIMPCLIELGPAAKEVHQKIGKKIGQICDFSIITTKDWFEEIRKAAVAEGMKPESIIFSENPQEIFEKIKPFLQPENVILLEGRLPKELLKIVLN
ncbi:UDP-N-acetylmuramoyl-tripeptide--D-alanyl-D-alanine ligase [Candidatus Parcubacteria bacterium]|nr:UDP-N-acetylmuramoyl-tripeptide--D-alanyl-D-alanine ligase [Patescibacteria group bacterium]MBU4466513.1 UDP-N-acetylmuramoyl-tripeptide--D-alanyl-D-alanine ligase [Patescibacteria group bacterium]MCG2688791.1 UDP-N-acetylmuramoyl-tripeptide--D-alanyl-D-alanine ligase [Candidatus Parcubacteria bacterium]